MAVEWARWGVRVNAISPGPFLTEIMQRGRRARPGLSRPDRGNFGHEAGR